MILNSIKRMFGRSLSHEAVLAYWHKLPNRIQVEWLRDGKFIIGRIDADGTKLITQALSAKEFVDMVNEAVLAAYDISEQYFKILKEKRFKPTPEHFKKLDDTAIKKSHISFELVTA